MRGGLRRSCRVFGAAEFLVETEKPTTLLSTCAALEEDLSSGLSNLTVVLYGSASVGISRMLSPDDVVKVRACARCWNDGVFFCDLGNLIQYGQCERGGAQRRLRHQFVDSIRKCAQGEPPDVVAVKEILIEFVGNTGQPGLALRGAQHCTSPGGYRGHKLCIE